MRWYVNDVSLQGQFSDERSFESLLRELIAERAKSGLLRQAFHMTRQLPERPVTSSTSLRAMVQSSRDRDFRSAALSWFDRNGPFIDDDRADESDDYFEFQEIDVTDSALGEAARRIKRREQIAVFSFTGGTTSFGHSPLVVDHGMPEQRYGRYVLDNMWTIDALHRSISEAAPPITSWRALIESARERFLYLDLPDEIYKNNSLSKEAFDYSIRDRVLELMSYLNDYVGDRGPQGQEGPAARSIIERFFVGERARFTGESPTNREQFRTDLTFRHPRIPGQDIFAHWHGKISRRFFRLHFEWPLAQASRKLVICYLGPKITKS